MEPLYLQGNQGKAAFVTADEGMRQQRIPSMYMEVLMARHCN